jgi:hypothetical protein
MLSRHKITRQIPLTTTYYDAYKVVTQPEKYAYSFIPTSGQGTYTNVSTTKGYMVSAEVDDISLGGTLTLSINQAVAAAGGPDKVILRDLGCTIYAQYWTFINIGTFDKNAKGYFRKVQLISPTALGANGWNGGPNGSTFGVTGFPSESFQISNGGSNSYNSTSYLTFYIPVSIANITGDGATSTEAFAIAGGQV